MTLSLHARVGQERQKQLESMGISLETSGIKVGEDKCFLVNLNADPALNELLVYYLKVRIRKTWLAHCAVSDQPLNHQPQHGFVCCGSHPNNLEMYLLEEKTVKQQSI